MIKNSNISREYLVSQIEGNIVSDMDGEKVMLSVENGKYYNLGEVGGEIWDILREPILPADIISILMNKFEVSQTECEKQVMSFLNQLLEDGLIQTKLDGNS